MYRVDNPSSAAALAAPTAPTATPDQYYVDPAGPVPGTIVDAEHLNMIQEEMCNLVTNAGVALSKATRTQLTTVAGGAAAIKSHATDTGAVTTLHAAAVIAASASGATNLRTAAIGCSKSFCSQIDSAILGSLNAELGSPRAIGGGYDAGADIAETGGNQNLTWIISAVAGDAVFKNIVQVGGDVDLGTGETAKMDGPTGEVTATGGLRITDGHDEAAETYLQTPVNIGATSFASYDVPNDSIVATSIVLWSFSTTEALFQGRCVPGLHTVKFEVYNPSGVAATADITFSYIVVNPA